MENKALLHIPKNAGTTIRDLFQPVKPIWEKHACLQEMADTLGDSFYEYEFLCITRNPYSRLYSWFKYHSKFKSLSVYWNTSFEEWVSKYCPHHWFTSPHFGGKWGFKYKAYLEAPISQKRFLEVDMAIPRNVQFIKLEELNYRWDFVCDFFGKKIEAKTSNKSAGIGEWKKAYNEATKKIASQLMKEDLEHFNYEF